MEGQRINKPIAIRNAIMASICHRTTPQCARCPSLQRCKTAATLAAGKIIEEFFVIPRTGDSAADAALLNLTQKPDIVDIDFTETPTPPTETPCIPTDSL